MRSTRAHVAPASSILHSVSTSWQDGPMVKITADQQAAGYAGLHDGLDQPKPVFFAVSLS